VRWRGWEAVVLANIRCGLLHLPPSTVTVAAWCEMCIAYTQISDAMVPKKRVQGVHVVCVDKPDGRNNEGSRTFRGLERDTDWCHALSNGA
jgi:hypothetical protein